MLEEEEFVAEEAYEKAKLRVKDVLHTSGGGDDLNTSGASRASAHSHASTDSHTTGVKHTAEHSRVVTEYIPVTSAPVTGSARSFSSFSASSSSSYRAGDMPATFGVTSGRVVNRETSVFQPNGADAFGRGLSSISTGLYRYGGDTGLGVSNSASSFEMSGGGSTSSYRRSEVAHGPSSSYAYGTAASGMRSTGTGYSYGVGEPLSRGSDSSNPPGNFY